MPGNRKTSNGKPEYPVQIPDRNEILEFLRGCKAPRSLDHIAQALHVESDGGRAALDKRLRAMLRDGQVIKNRREGYGLIDKMDLTAGRVIGHHEGFGFLRPDSGDKDIFLSPREMRSLLHGDRAVVRSIGEDRKGRPAGALVEVVARANERIVGRYFREHQFGYVVPDNKRIHQDILIPNTDQGQAKSGQFVVAEITRQPDKHTQPVGKVIEILKEENETSLAVDIAIRAYELPHVWPDEVKTETATLDPAARVDSRGREDFRDLPFVTIDGEDARDFDDAVYCSKTEHGWRLLVAIADVSHYVKQHTFLDGEAELRGTSVYFPQRVVPMLPEILSNELCSLKPAVDRLVLVCELAISRKGKVKSYRFTQGVIRSAARMTYTDVAGLVAGHDKRLGKKYQRLSGYLNDLHELYRLMHARRRSLGLLDFNATESKFQFDELGNITRIDPLRRNDAHRMIEEFMLAANTSAADYLLVNKVPILYRNHEPPGYEKLIEVREFLGEFGLELGGGDEPEARHYANLIEQVKDREDAHLIETVLLRSMQLAFYGEQNLGHFGLAFVAYTHFTSPIRRYPDLLVHRAIKFLLGRNRKKDYPYTLENMHQLGESCSMTERRAEEASREVLQRLKCLYMRDKVGQVYTGTVSSVTGFGLFVELDDFYIEGLIHVTSLPADYYHHDAIGHRLRGERSGRTYRLAGRLKVKVMRVDAEDRKIDFELADSKPVKSRK
jgi:ribonuclease R